MHIFDDQSSTRIGSGAVERSLVFQGELKDRMGVGGGAGEVESHI